MKYQFSICRTIATVFVVALLAYVILTGTSASRFLNLPFFILISGLSFLMILIVYEMEFLKFIPHALQVFFCRPLEPNPRFVRMALFGSRSVIGAGLIGMLIILIQMTSNLSDPPGISVGIATSLVCPFYAVLTSEIFFAIVHQSFKEPHNKTKSGDTLPLVNAGLPLLLILFTLSVFAINVLMFARFSISHL